MKLITYKYNNAVTLGAVNADNEVVALTAVAPDMLTLIKMGPDGLVQAQQLLDQAEQTLPLADVELLAPIPQPVRNIMCLGKNYAEHAQESHAAWGDKHELPEFPIIFNKATTSINSPYGDIPYDTAVSSAIDYEAELAVIIGRTGKNISAADALDYVFGYTVINDVSARDLQRQHKQFFKGKSLDGSAPLGPWIVTAVAIPDPHNLQVTCKVNGVEKQNGNTNQMIFDIPETIRQLSLGMTLLPGDIIATGTPSGVGFARTPPEFLVPGDVVECSVEHIGTIRNKIG